jgi:meso-butanediol dehydrogenase/(S,S)-butanediol dehydrogenase/diacetyl reductase
MSTGGPACFQGVAIITGAASGIGAAVSVALASGGASVALVDRDPVGLAATAELIRSTAPVAALATLTADVTRSEDAASCVAAVARDLGVPGTLVNSAGVEGRVCAVHEYTDEEFDHVWSVNTRGAWLMTKHVARRMIEAGEGGTIVNVSSVAAVRATPLLAAYVVSKHAVVGLTRASAVDLAPHGIRVNAVCPGPVDTRMMASLNAQRAGNGTAEHARNLMAGRTLLKRFASPSEIAEIIAFLTSGSAAFMTGAVVIADGGLTI